MSYRNLTDISNYQSLGDLLKLANDSTGNLFWTAIYFMLVLIMIISGMVVGFEGGLLIGLFGGLVVGMFLLYLGLINPIIFWTTEGILLLFVIYLMYTSRSNN